MKEIYILYLIVHRNRKLLKIGKTKKSYRNTRYSNIDKDFKGVVFNKSYWIESESKAEIDNLERVLHKLFYKDRKSKAFKTGVGKTEWFEIGVLPLVLKEIKHLKKNNENFKMLSDAKKGIRLKSSFKDYIFAKTFLLLLLMAVFYLFLLYKI